MHRVGQVLLVAWLLVSVCSSSAAQERPKSNEFEKELVREAVDLSAARTDEQADGAKDMESLLHWAIENSDPAVLAEKAGRQEKSQEEVVKEFVEKKQRVKELYDAVNRLPTEASLIKDTVKALTAEGASTEAKLASLVELQQLVEPIDNANDLHTLGGLAPVVALLGEPHAPSLRAAAAHVVGTAASNNLKFIRQLVSLHPGVTESLLAVSQLADDAAAAKGLYALGTVVRGSREARAAFYAASGLAQLEAAMAPGAASARVRSKALHLLTDLIEMSYESKGDGQGGGGDDNDEGAAEVDRLAAGVLPQFANAALHLLQNADNLRGQETALLALRTILSRRPNDGAEVLAAQGAEGVLREALVELEAALLEPEEPDLGEGEEEDGGSESGSGHGSGGGGGSSGGSGGGEGDEAAQDDAYRGYLATICADLLQDISSDKSFDVGHDEL